MVQFRSLRPILTGYCEVVHKPRFHRNDCLGCKTRWFLPEIFSIVSWLCFISINKTRKDEMATVKDSCLV